MNKNNNYKKKQRQEQRPQVRMDGPVLILKKLTINVLLILQVRDNY